MRILKQLSWIIRLTFDKSQLMENGIVMEDIYLAMMEYDNDKIEFVFSDDNSKELIGRISIKDDVSLAKKVICLMDYRIRQILYHL